jgi:cell division septum initiation protein DivIVA
VSDETGSEEPGVPSVLDVLEAVDALVAEARRVPFSGNVVVNDSELTDMLDRIRTSLPEELVEAQRLLDQRERILVGTEEEAAQMRERAEAEAQRLVEEAQARVEALRVQVQTEVRRLLDQARAQAEKLVSADAVAQIASERSAVLLHDAEENAQRVAAEADEYVRAVMTGLEEQLVKATTTVRRGLKALAPPQRRR